MKRGERQMWRKLADAIEKLVESDDYAKEYMARRDIERLIDNLSARNIANRLLFLVER